MFEELKGIIRQYDIKDLADHAEISPNTIQRWLSGKTKSPRHSNLLKVCDVLGLDVVIKPQRTILKR